MYNIYNLKFVIYNILLIHIFYTINFIMVVKNFVIEISSFLIILTMENLSLTGAVFRNYPSTASPKLNALNRSEPILTLISNMTSTHNLGHRDMCKGKLSFWHQYCVL